MAEPKTLCVVHNNVNDASSIGKIARWAVRTALDAGWQVTVVARDLDRELRSSVDWRRLYVPPRVHAVQWLAARPTIKRALDGDRFDVVHVYQSQVAGIADVFHCQFLSRPAYEADGFPTWASWRSSISRAQLLAVMRAEERYLRRLPVTTHVAFCSQLMQDEFTHRYGVRDRMSVLPNPGPQPVELSTAERRQARERLVGADFDGVVVGFLGGVDRRKGFEDLVDAVRKTPGTYLLMAGPGSEGFLAEGLQGRMRSLGHLNGLREFFAAADVLAAPSRFEPYGVVVNEAAAHAVPSIVTPEVGSADEVVAAGAGVVWRPGEDFSAALHAASAARAAGCRKLAVDHSEAVLGERLLGLYESLLERKRVIGFEHDGRRVASIRPTSEGDGYEHG